MAKYRKRLVLIEAALYDGALVGEPDGQGSAIRGTCPDWFPAVVRETQGHPLAEGLRSGEVVTFGGDLWIGALDGAHIASPGDMIVRGTAGEIYPVKPSIFREIYDPQAVA